MSLQSTYALGQGLSPIQEAVRSQFSEGSPAREWLIVLATVVGLVALGVGLYLRSKWTMQPEVLDDPHRLFDDLLDGLRFSDQQRSFVRTAVEDSRLQHPAVILLSPVLYDRYVTSWSMRHRYEGAQDDRGDLLLAAQVRSKLFPGSPQFPSEAEEGDWPAAGDA